MPTIELHTHIDAPQDRVFDLARSIDAHMASTGRSGEEAVAGRTSGLIECGETVTWRATHFLVRQTLTVRITAMERPYRFTDEMTDGAFAAMKHTHTFVPEGNGTIMIDEFTFQAPWGLLGRLAERCFLTAYMRKFLQQRAHVLKSIAEGEAWREYLR